MCCGPGNQVSPGEILTIFCLTAQGGDGLVAARHLHQFRYTPTIYLPKPGSKDIYKRLLKQCQNLHIPVLSTVEELESELKETNVILDAIFGMSLIDLGSLCYWCGNDWCCRDSRTTTTG